jgi:HNH endonuclease
MKNGTPHIPKGQRNTAERCMKYYVEKMPDGGCWVWTGKISKNGYGAVTVNYKSVGAHRFFYEELVGPIPEGLVLDHLCRNRACVNPAHLEQVTCRVNNLRGTGFAAVNAKKVVCLRGHPLDGGDVYITKKGQRYCRVCNRLRMAGYVQRGKQSGR